MYAISNGALTNRIRSNSKARGLGGIYVSLNDTCDSLGHPSF